MLAWMPDHWGRIDEFGEFALAEESLAGLLAVFAAGCVVNQLAVLHVHRIFHRLKAENTR